MAISLTKGGNVSLTKEAPSLRNVLVGLGWDARATAGSAFDLDASVFLCNAAGKVSGESDFVFYNNLRSTDGSVEHLGDNRDGGGDGDDEAIRVDLARLRPDVQKLSFCVTIHEADTRRQNFGMVSNGFIRIVNDATRAEIARFDLSEDASVETTMIFGEIYRHGSDWKFRAVGQGMAGGLGELAASMGVNV